MSDREKRELHGVVAGDYVYLPRSKIPTIANNERNALAFLLTIPWTTGLWSCHGLPMYGKTPWKPEHTRQVLLSAQAIIPNMAQRTLAAAIQVLAAARPGSRDGAPPQS